MGEVAPRAAGALWRLGPGATLALGAAVAVTFLCRGGDRPVSQGEVVAEARETVAIGGRGVALAEAGSELAWQVSRRGGARIDQRAGEVLYRVEGGRPFTVVTPTARAIAMGTSFRVEVRPGATALAVSEGRVLFSGDRGRLEVRAGESAEVVVGGGPVLTGSPNGLPTR